MLCNFDDFRTSFDKLLSEFHEMYTLRIIILQKIDIIAFACVFMRLYFLEKNIISKQYHLENIWKLFVSSTSTGALISSQGICLVSSGCHARFGHSGICFVVSPTASPRPRISSPHDLLPRLNSGSKDQYKNDTYVYCYLVDHRSTQANKVRTPHGCTEPEPCD